MREEYAKLREGKKIAIYGSRREIEEAKIVLDGLNLVGSEYEDRLVIQEAIDRNGVKADILYDGNTVWSYDRLVRDFRRAIRSGPSRVTEHGNGDYNLTNYLYEFFHLDCGSIAHYNKHGWIGTYPTKEDLKRFCRHNEFGLDILRQQPRWASDGQRIAKAILEMC